MTTLLKYKVTTVPTARIHGILSTGRHAAPDIPATLHVLDTQPGPLTWRDKLKAYYHTLIVAVGSLLTILTMIVLPGQYGGWVASAVLVLTTVKTALTANETWIEAL